MDLRKTVYTLYLVTNSGGSDNPSSGAIQLPFTGLQYEEQPNELAVRLQATIPNQQTPLGWIHQLAALAAPVVLFADWGDGPSEVFRGKVWTWEFTDDGSQNVMLTCYDDLMYLNVTQDDRAYYAPIPTGAESSVGSQFNASSYGSAAAPILTDIAQAWGFTINNLDGLPSMPLPRFVFANTTVASMIVKVLEEVYYRSGEAWLLRARQGNIELVPPGNNTPVYVLSNATVTNYSDQQDMTQLITEVEVLGMEANAGLGYVDTQAGVQLPPAGFTYFLEGNTQYGRIRAIVQDPGPMAPIGSAEMAQRLLQDRGEPRRVERFTAPDLPFLRRGDAVYLQTGTLIGTFYVDGVQHDADSMTMQLEINTSGSADAHLNNAAKISMTAGWLQRRWMRQNGWTT